MKQILNFVHKGVIGANRSGGAVATRVVVGARRPLKEGVSAAVGPSSQHVLLSQHACGVSWTFVQNLWNSCRFFFCHTENEHDFKFCCFKANHLYFFKS